MPKLITVNKYVWLIVAFTIVASFVVLFIFLRSKVPSIAQGVVTLDGDTKKVMYVDMDFAYKTRVGNVLNFKINDEFYSATIKAIHWDEIKGKFALEVAMDNSVPFFKGSALLVTIIYDSHRIIDGLLGSV